MLGNLCIHQTQVSSPAPQLAFSHQRFRREVFPVCGGLTLCLVKASLPNLQGDRSLGQSLTQFHPFHSFRQVIQSWFSIDHDCVEVSMS